jgi:tetratricopeptide (TPR) repeat protein
MNDSMHERAAAGAPRWTRAVAMFALGLAALGAVRSAAADPLKIDEKDVSSATDNANKYPEVQEALKKLQAQDFAGALESLKAASKAHPELSAPHVLLGQYFLRARQLPAARSALEAAVKEDPNDPEPYLIFGELAVAEKQWTDASLLFDKAAALLASYKGDAEKKKKYEISDHGGLAAVAEARENWDVAQQQFQAMLKLDPKNAQAHFRLGQAMFNEKKGKDPAQAKAAYAELKAASTFEARFPSAEVMLGRLYQAHGDKENAAKWIDYAAKTYPKDAKVRTEVAQWLWENGRYAEAKPHLDEALKIDPKSIVALVTAGRVARYAKDYATAAQHLEKASIEEPGNPQIASELALALLEQDDEAKKQRALKLAESNYQQNQRSADAAATLGWVYYRLGQLEKAEQLLRMAAQSGNISSDVAYYLAKINNDRSRTDEAKKLLEAALKSQAPFAYRPEAQKWYDQLAKQP